MGRAVSRMWLLVQLECVFAVEWIHTSMHGSVWQLHAKLVRLMHRSIISVTVHSWLVVD
ncbi:hypothetical protein M758_3G118000 [Ceratodon purpureus]|uniref:Secreted protein n=1 Tax=Ceratodon purpureus TaxID=3225 RepID=A0A8T0IHC4_CERPU|nr:hypothetical protein KC19_3G116600 [Ceratodon purpureus]KAG0622710.1 hypothetical protein M758_3G118000 [Ceratodon purpureus]